ncbi:MAG: hypothetical protein E7Z75_00075 [Methanobrevibacter olleyae]|uniref:Uncharacterized protein n=1 Tax=Methanobrevibacter olleyae TaxID=294671 RepID=A0A8T3VJ25_METOL|nr:hypothetical protein [Methanobrevibacter olleyae]
MLIEENKRDCILNNFKLINQKEIIDFIRSNTGLLELIEKVYPLLKFYFPNYSYSLLYAPDPEIAAIEDLMLLINADIKDYEYNKNKLYDLEREIDDLEISDCKVKRLLLLDV